MTYNGPRCLGKAKVRDELGQPTGERRPCHAPPIPFGDYCRHHGGNRKQHREIARLRMLEYERNTTDPYYMKRRRIGYWEQSQARYEMRLARKTSPEAVEGLKRERAALKAQKKREFAENARATAEKHRRAVEEARRRGTLARPQRQPEPAPTPTGPIQFEGFEFSDWEV